MLFVGSAAWAGQGYLGEVEPNGTSATASPIVGSNVVVRANLFPNGDVDFYSSPRPRETGSTRPTMTAFSARQQLPTGSSPCSPSDGTTVIEFDDDNGSFAGSLLEHRRRRRSRPPGPTS